MGNTIATGVSAPFRVTSFSVTHGDTSGSAPFVLSIRFRGPSGTSAPSASLSLSCSYVWSIALTQLISYVLVLRLGTLTPVL
jgi:hypothetical protein